MTCDAQVAKEKVGAFRWGDLDITQILLQLYLAGHEADVGANCQGVANLDSGHPGVQCVDELGVDHFR